MDKIVRQRIYSSVYWKEQCFNINSAGICDKAAQLDKIGGVIGGRPLPFLCLLQKLLLLEPQLEIIIEYLEQPYLKYLTALAVVYVRLTRSKSECEKLLGPLLKDWRKLRLQTTDQQQLIHMDELVDKIMLEKRYLGLTLPRFAAE